MLTFSRKYRNQVAEALGYDNVEFGYGRIQDLRLDLDLLGKELQTRPVGDTSGWWALRTIEERFKSQPPLIAADSIDCIVSN